MPDLAAELRRHEAYAFPVQEVKVLETHISWVFLAGPFAYKVKKPVNLGFVDYSTLEQRRAYCRAEVELNRRLAPDVYLGVVPITSWGGSLRMEGPGEPVEYAVKMRRLSQDRMLDELLKAGGIGAADIERLAREIATFHAAAATGSGVDDFGRRPVIERNWRENFDQVQPFIGRLLTPGQQANVQHYVHRELDRLAPIFEERVRTGRVRDCHGDLRCESVWMSPEGRFEVFDCIEFNDRLRYSDVASEVAFLSSDLDWRGRPDLAWTWVDAYLEASSDAGLRQVLPFYKTYRAFVRGKVEAMQWHILSGVPERCRHARAAREHFQFAEWYTLRFAPTLLLTCGQVGSGKTAVARGLGSILGLEVVSSDRVRKQLAGVARYEHRPSALDRGLYGPDLTRQTYDELYARAARLLSAGESVILDATFAREDDRRRAAQLAASLGAGYMILMVEAPDSVIYRRLAQRRHQPGVESDAGPDIFEQVRTRFETPDGVPPRSLLHVDASRSVRAAVEPAVERLRQRLPLLHSARRSA